MLTTHLNVGILEKMPDQPFDLVEFCRRMPKVELHAHLNGSVSRETLLRLVSYKQRTDNIDLNLTCLEKEKTGTLDQVFGIFKLLHSVVDSYQAVLLATVTVVREFHADNVKYLELRTTPRVVPATGLQKKDYMHAVLDGIRQCTEDEALDIIVRVMISIDRAQDLKAAEENVSLAIALRDEGETRIVGVDLSGDPKVSDARLFIPVLLKAKQHGLRVSAHLAECRDKISEVTQTLTHLLPDRVGHATFLCLESGGCQEGIKVLVERKIPIELCLTSNIKCQTVTAYQEHHLGYWLKLTHPVIVGTDDKGVFDTTLSDEYILAARHFGLTGEQIWSLSFGAIEHIFGTDIEKELLRSKFVAAYSDLISAF